MSIIKGIISSLEESLGVKVKNPELIADFEDLLQSYAKSYKLTRERVMMKCIDNALIELVKKNINQPDRVLVALAGIVGHLVFSKLTADKLVLNIPQKLVKKTRTEAISHSAEWLSGNNRTTFLKQKKLLTQLLEEHFKNEDSLLH